MLKRNLIANYLGQGWTILMGLAFIPIYIRYLGIEAYGLIGLFAVMQAWLGLLDMGMGPALGREMARFSTGLHTPQSIHNLLRSLEVIVLILGGLIFLFVWCVAEWLTTDWLKVEKLPVSAIINSITLTGLIIGLRFLESLYRSALINLQIQVWYNGANALLATFRYAGAVGILALISPTIEAFFLWQAGVSVVGVIVYHIKLYGVLPIAPNFARFSPSEIGKVIKFSIGMLGINLLSILLTQIDKVILSRILSLEYYGYYIFAGIIATGLTMLISPIALTLYPRMIQLSSQQNKDALAKVFHQGSQLVTIIAAPISLVIAIFPVGIVYLWSGNMSLANHTAPILVPLILGTLLNSLMVMPSQCQLAHGWTSLQVKFSAISVAILVPAIIWLVPIYGAIAAAWIWVILNSVYVLVVGNLMFRKILNNEIFKWYFDDIIRPLLGSLFVIFMFKTMIQPEVGAGRLEWAAFIIATSTVASTIGLMLAGQIWKPTKAKIKFIFKALIQNKIYRDK